MSTNLDRVLSVVLTVCAVTVVGITVARQMRPMGATMALGVLQPTMIEGWREILSQGRQVGDPTADIQLIEFIDFQCPFCQAFHNDVLRAGEDVIEAPLGIVLVHFPLPSHPLAMPLARGAECAERQGMLPDYVDAVFSDMPQADDTEVWLRLARSARLPNEGDFLKCVESQDPEIESRIEGNRMLGLELGVNGTPTVLLNGWRFPTPPNRDELVRVAKALREGREPF